MKISIKNKSEIEKIQIASQIAADTLAMIGEHIKPGISTEEIDKICHDFIEAKGAIPAALNYKGFPKSICTSVNNQVCHGIPGKKVLKEGDIINVDVAVIKDDYYGDTSKMYTVGKVSILADRLIRVTQECLYKAIAIVKPGTCLGDIGAIIQQHAENERFSVVREFCGHGLGKNFHEPPNVLHYGTFGEGLELKPGMVFTIEPMINAGKRHIRILPDKWTVTTKDRSLSAQWEHTIVVTKDGHEVLSRRSEEIDLP